MATLNVVIGFTNLLIALLVAIAAGITLRREPLYRAQHRYAANCFLRWSIALAAGGLLALVMPLETCPACTIALLLAPLLYLGAVWQIRRHQHASGQS